MRGSSKGGYFKNILGGCKELREFEEVVGRLLEKEEESRERTEHYHSIDIQVKDL